MPHVCVRFPITVLHARGLRQDEQLRHQLGRSDHCWCDANSWRQPRQKNAEHQFQIWQHEPGRSLSMQDARTRRLGMHNLWYCAITWPRAATKETSKNLTNKWSSHPVALNKMIIIARKSRVILKLYTSLRRTDLSAAQGVQLWPQRTARCIPLLADLADSLATSLYNSPTSSIARRPRHARGLHLRCLRLPRDCSSDPATSQTARRPRRTIRRPLCYVFASLRLSWCAIKPFHAVRIRVLILGSSSGPW